MIEIFVQNGLKVLTAIHWHECCSADLPRWMESLVLLRIPSYPEATSSIDSPCPNVASASIIPTSANTTTMSSAAHFSYDRILPASASSRIRRRILMNSTYCCGPNEMRLI